MHHRASVSEKPMPPPDQDKLNTLLGRIVGDLGAIVTGALVRPGDRLGRFMAMTASGPMTAAKLAAATKTPERFVREWISGQAAADYFEYGANLAGSWRPALDAMVEKLERGALAGYAGLGQGLHPGFPLPGRRTGSGRPARGDDAAPDRNGWRLRRAIETPFNMVLEARP